jgi:hypothetical protein
MPSSSSSTSTSRSHKLLVELFPEQPPLCTDRIKQIHTYNSVEALQHDLLHTEWITSSTGGQHLRYADLCYIRDFIYDIRQKYAPTTSYDIHQRSSKVLVDLNASLGWMTCSAARKHDKFTNVVANDAYKPVSQQGISASSFTSMLTHTAASASSPYYPLLQQNVALYKYQNVYTTNHDFLSFFLETYAQHAPNSVVYFDVTLPTTPTMIPIYNDNNGDKTKTDGTNGHADDASSESQQSMVDYEIVSEYANDPHSLTELVEHLLSGKLFQTGRSIEQTCHDIS